MHIVESIRMNIRFYVFVFVKTVSVIVSDLGFVQFSCRLPGGSLCKCKGKTESCWLRLRIRNA